METKLMVNLQAGILEVSGSEDFVNAVYSEFLQLKTSSGPIKKKEVIQQKKAQKDMSVNKSKIATRTSPSLLTDLNLRPKNEINLKEFCSKYDISSNFEYNTVFVYYLDKILKINNINIDHIFTCYKEIGVRVPIIYQSLIDTKRRKGWIKTSDLNNIKLSIQGENFVDHDIKKKVKIEKDKK